MKALSRRGLFGAGAGAVAAASIPSAGGIGPAPGRMWARSLSDTQTVQAIPIEEWAPVEIKSLRSELEHVLGNRDLELHGPEHYDHAAIDSLRSVSPVTRARMHAELTARIARGHEARRIQDRIDDLIERLGPLAKVLL